MKNPIVLFIGLLLMNFNVANSSKDQALKNLSPDKSIHIYCSPDLYSLTSTWADAFCNLHSDLKIEVTTFEESSVAENFDIKEYLGFISGEYPEMYNKSVWTVVVGRDVIVPVFNSKNPFADEICQQGISSEEFPQIFKYPELKHWGTLLNNQENVPVNFYLVEDEDESVHLRMAELIGFEQITIDGIRVGNGEELIHSILKDPYSIGFCKITNIPDPGLQTVAEGIKLLPIDRNGNGEIDYMEKIYDDLNVLARGVWIGKYPKALINDLYFISSEKPTKDAEIAFIQWILTDGQQYLANYGYSDLLASERRSKVDLLNDYEFNVITPERNYATQKWLLFFILGSFGVVVFILIATNLQRISDRADIKAEIPDTIFNLKVSFDEHLVDIPMGLFYDKTHTWVYMEKDGMVKIGIDDFLQHVTGPLTRIKMKKTGEKIRKGKHALSIIQNGKQLNIRAPVSGTIKEHNKDLNNRSSLINSSPYSDGWIYKIEPTNWVTEIQFLIMWGKYKEWLKSEFSRLKDFLAISVKSNAEYAHVMQDGGELQDGILVDLGPEVWEDFQTNFIDTAT